MIVMGNVNTKPNGAVANLSKFGNGETPKNNHSSNHYNKKPIETTERLSSQSCDSGPHEDEDDGSLSSLSVYDDFPRLYFAVRRGRYANNSVFLSWESARKHIVDYPDAKYIATPTLKQAHCYTNGFGEFDEQRFPRDRKAGPEGGVELPPTDPNPRELPKPMAQAIPEMRSSSASSTKQTSRKASKRSCTTRSLVLDYYELYDPAYKAKGEKPLTIQKFLKERKMYKTKFRVFAKHWQRSGLLMMSNEERPLEDAVFKYDAWVQGRKLDKLEEFEMRGAMTKSSKTATKKTDDDDDDDDEEDESGKKSRKRKRPMALVDKHYTTPTAKSNDKADDLAGSTKKRKKRSPSSTPSPPTIRSTTTKKTAVRAKYTSSWDDNLPISQAIMQSATIVDPSRRRREKSRATTTDEEGDDDNDESWNAMYAKLKAFHSEHGHCKIPQPDYPELNRWVQYTRRRMRLDVKRFGARALTLREEKLLNDLDFDPHYKEIVTEFNKYLGMRVAKLFNVKIDSDSDDDDSSSSVPSRKDKTKPRVKKKPFFGTVGRISSVCNRYLRIQYDDGDSEDFDKGCLLEGLKVYNKYKHKDPLGGKRKSDPSAGVSGGTRKKKKDKTAENHKDTPGGNASTDPSTGGVGVARKMKNKKSGENRDESLHKNVRHGIDIPSTGTTNQGNSRISKTKSKSSHDSDDIEDTEQTANSSIGSRSKTLGNATTDQRNILEATITPDRDSNSSDDSSSNQVNDTNSKSDETDGDSSSDDEVEIVEVLVPYRGNPTLVELQKTGSDDSSGDKRFGLFNEGVFDF